jgi:transcriptional regulator GlxA family with amidase domain
MIRVSIIVPQGCSLFNSIIRLCRIFNYANSFLRKQQEDMLFTVDFVGVTSHVNLYGNRISVRPHHTLDDSCECDLVIIPALAGNIADGLRNNPAFTPWIIEQYHRGAEIAGLCTGTFLMADTHLVNEAGCIKNWYVSAGFRKEFSQVNMVAEHLILQEKAISADSGAYTFIRRLLESQANTSLTEACAGMFETEFNRECQSIFSIVDQEIRIEIPGKKPGSRDSPPFTENRQSELFEERFYATLSKLQITDEYELADINDNPNICCRKEQINAVTFKEIFRKIIKP